MACTGKFFPTGTTGVMKKEVIELVTSDGKRNSFRK